MCDICGQYQVHHSNRFFNLNSASSGTNQGLANYLTTGFWDDSGFTASKFNLSNSGIYAKNGSITYNHTSNNFDNNGLSVDRRFLVDEAFKYFELITGIDFQSTSDLDADYQFGDFDNNAYSQVFSSSGNTNYVTVNVNSSPVVSLPNFNPLCDNDSPINLSMGIPFGGNYFINNNPNTIFTPSSSNIGSNLITYTYMNSYGCSDSTTQNIIVNESPYASASTSNVRCNGFSDGTAILNISNGNPPYNIDWGNINPMMLSAGSYGYTVNDNNSCSYSDSVIIYEPSPFNIAINTTNINCNGQNDGTANVIINSSPTPNGTISNLTYCTSNPGSNISSTINNVELYGDINNIINNTSGSCDQYEDYTFLYADFTEGQNYTISVELGDCSNNNYPSGAKIFIDWNIDGDFLDPGEEIATIPNGLNSTASIPLNVPYSNAYGPTRMRIVSQFLNNLPANIIGPCDVGVMANPIYIQPWFGSTEDYSLVINPSQIIATYSWSSGQSTDSISGLSSGNYSVDVTDQNGCVSTSFFNISEPTGISTIENQTNISCYGGNNGSFSINVSGGTPNYILNTNGISQNLTSINNVFNSNNNLIAGIYPYSIIDSNNCVYLDSIYLQESSPISVIETINHVSCYNGNNGNVSFVISGGNPPYSQDWGIFNPNNLSAGNYNYDISDANGCLLNDSVTINQPSEILVSYTFNNVSACGVSDGNINLSVTGGISPYTYSWSNGSSSEDIYNLPSGTYNLLVTDINSCSKNITVTITEPNSPIITHNQYNVSCNGFSDANIDLNINGGASPYQYIWSNGSTSQDIFNLTAGNYHVDVIDDNNCMSSYTVNITEPATINLTYTSNDVTTCNGNDGNIDISPNGGVFPYSFMWSNNSTNEDIVNLSSGIYYLDIIDNNNCIYSFSFNINEPSGITVNEIINDVSCFGGNDGSIVLNISGGQPPFIEIWNIPNPLSLSAGNYNYSITDSINCTFSNSITILEPQEISTNPNINNVLCYGENSGNIILNISGGTLPYYENWNSNNPNLLYAGYHNYSIIDNNGCLYSDSIYISEPTPIYTNINTNNASCYNYNDGNANVNVNGGSPPYNINWQGFNNMSLAAGNYEALVTDNNGCSDTINFIINEPPPITFTVDTFRTSCYGYNDGSAILTINGGNSPFTIDWFGANPILLPAGNHQFSITDSNNCTQLSTVTITEPNLINTNEITSNVKCNGENNGSVFLEIIGGTPPYNQNWNNINLSELSAGIYDYVIIDNNGCTFLDSITIYEPDIISVNEIISHANCYNSNNGQAILEINGGTPPYYQEWFNSNPLALNAGEHYYKVIDFNSCSFDDSIFINQANELIISTNIQSPICKFDSSKISFNITNPTSLFYTIEVTDEDSTYFFIIDSMGNNYINSNSIFIIPLYSKSINFISITDENNCTRPINIEEQVIVNELPTVSLSISDFCKQDSSRYITSGFPYGGTYLINNDTTSFLDIGNLDIDIYNIEYHYIDPITNCYSYNSKNIRINPNPTANFIYGPNLVDIDNPDVEFVNKSNDFNTIRWIINEDEIYENDFVYTFTEIGNFPVTLIVENSEGCIDSLTQDIKINPVYEIFIPNSFSPNSDNLNEKFAPKIRENGCLYYNMKIFNQWGEKIYDVDNGSWDGYFKGKICQKGTYSYKIIAYNFENKPQTYSGHFSLLR